MDKRESANVEYETPGSGYNAARRGCRLSHAGQCNTSHAIFEMDVGEGPRVSQAKEGVCRAQILAAQRMLATVFSMLFDSM